MRSSASEVGTAIPANEASNAAVVLVVRAAPSTLKELPAAGAVPVAGGFASSDGTGTAASSFDGSGADSASSWVALAKDSSSSSVGALASPDSSMRRWPCPSWASSASIPTAVSA